MISNGPTQISDGILVLREITPADSDLLYRWRFLHSPTRSMFRTTEIVSRDRHQRVIEHYFDPQNTDRWFIVEQEGAAVGTISLVGMNEEGKECETGRFIIDPEHRGMKLGSRSLALLLEYCRALGVRRVHSEILQANRASLQMFRKLGYRETGSFREAGREFLRLMRDLESPQ